MDLIIYFADKSVHFLQQSLDSPPLQGVVLQESDGVSRAKLLKILETENTICIQSDNPQLAFDRFAAQFWAVAAAGGVVVNPLGEWLMIYRNGRWDLPKGHIEAGEQPHDAALREVEEETGVAGVQIDRFLCSTHHAYYFPKTLRWELKRTYWFAMHGNHNSPLIPQIEEGIERVEWCSESTVCDYLCSSFPTIRRVADEMLIRG